MEKNYIPNNTIGSVKTKLIHFIATICVIMLAFSTVTGCMTVELSSNSSDAIMMSGEPNRDYTIVRSFSVPQKGWFALFDLVTVNNPNVQKTLNDELKRSGGDAIINVSIQGQTTFTDALIPIGMNLAGTLLGMAIAPDPSLGTAYGSLVGSLAAAMLSTRTYTVSGDVIRYND